MFRALRNTQTEMTQTLIKFAEEVASGSNTSSAAGHSSAMDSEILNTLRSIERNQESQVHLLEEMFQMLIKLNKMPSQDCVVDCCSTIPSLQPISAPIQMVEAVTTTTTTKLVEPLLKTVTVTKDEEEEVEEEEVEVEEVEVEEEEVEEEEVEEEEVEEEVEEEGIEVEEWTYKGLLLFKDQNNTVYKNEDGDVGDPIGTYDPVKKSLKKLASN